MSSSPEYRILSDGWLFRKTMIFRETGCVMEGHAHTWDHFTTLFAGALDVEVNGKVTRFACTQERPVIDIWITKGVVHRMVSAQPMTMAMCLHALHDPRDRTLILDGAVIPDGIPTVNLAAPLVE